MEAKDAEVVGEKIDPVEAASKEINAVLEKYGLAIAVSPPQPILVPKPKKSPVVTP